MGQYNYRGKGNTLSSFNLKEKYKFQETLGKKGKKRERNRVLYKTKFNLLNLTDLVNFKTFIKLLKTKKQTKVSNFSEKELFIEKESNFILDNKKKLYTFNYLSVNFIIKFNFIEIVIDKFEGIKLNNLIYSVDLIKLHNYHIQNSKIESITNNNYKDILYAIKRIK